MMFRIRIIQAQHNLSEDRIEFLVNDRLSFMYSPAGAALHRREGRSRDSG